MILSDRDIQERVNCCDLIHPFNQDNLQPASYDLTLGKEFLIPIGKKDIDVEFDDYPTFKKDTEDDFLLPKQYMLGTTKERVTIPSDIVGIVDGKSTLARMGLLVHLTAGYIDPGFSGQITLEFYNCSDNVIWLHKGMKIAQIRFQKLSSGCNRTYGHPDLHSHYQNQKGVYALGDIV